MELPAENIFQIILQAWPRYQFQERVVVKSEPIFHRLIDQVPFNI